MPTTRLATRPLRLEVLEAREVYNAAAPFDTTEGHGAGCACGACVALTKSGMGPSEHLAWALPPAGVTYGPPAPGDGAALYAAADTFALHSRPGAAKTIYLDFTGHTTRRTWWNTDFNGGRDIV